MLGRSRRLEDVLDLQSRGYACCRPGSQSLISDQARKQDEQRAILARRGVVSVASTVLRLSNNHCLFKESQVTAA